MQPLRLSRIFAAGLFVYGLSALAASAWAQNGGASLAPYRDRNRVLLVFAPSESDARYRKQSALFSGKTAGEQDRELVRYAVFETGLSRGPRGPISAQAARTLRRRYGVRPGQFRVLLVGKDGNVAYGQTSPVSADDLFARIDRMPMRREEMRRRGQLSSGVGGQ